ncbi:hypothetical protein CK203_094309 [Vitis vinifera]|uniref:Uncharacterized protein n=1 Tax=Vitis vinifera TaxID=29760 RepID=A0A438E0C1_VITVI|nr:hypothetical protein CK203_094309 [Vitis vinifera]
MGIMLYGCVIEENVGREVTYGSPCLMFSIWLQAFVNDSSSYGRLNQITKIKPKREITEESLGLKPLCSEVCLFTCLIADELDWVV